jgi:hypothetical protein
VAALCFALAAALQQLGQFRLAVAGAAVRGPAGLFRLLAVPVWLLGTLILLVGYATQAVALDHGRLVVVQPLMVTTVVWALPLGYCLAALSGAVLITLANRETPVPGQQTGTHGALVDETLS